MRPKVSFVVSLVKWPLLPNVRGQPRGGCAQAVFSDDAAGANGSAPSRIAGPIRALAVVTGSAVSLCDVECRRRKLLLQFTAHLAMDLHFEPEAAPKRCALLLAFVASRHLSQHALPQFRIALRVA